MTRSVLGDDPAPGLRVPDETVRPSVSTEPGAAEALLPGRPRGYRAVRLGVLGAHLVVTVVLAARSFFFADDLLYGSLLGQAALGPDLLFRSWFGHLVPGFIAADWTFYRVAGLDWRVASLVMVLVGLAATVALLRLLEALVGRTWRTLAVTALFGLSLPVVTQVLWWGAVLTNLVPLAASVATLGSFTRWARSGRVRHLVSMTGCFVLAVAFYEKSVLTAVYVLALSVLVLDGGLPLRERMLSTLRRWPAWVLLAVVALVDGVFFLRGEFLAEAGPAPRPRDLAAFLFHSLTEGFAPSLLGIHLPDVAFLDSRLLTLVVANGLLLGVVAVSALRFRRALDAWLFFAVGFLLNQGVLGWGRLNSVAYSSIDVDSTLGVLGPHMGSLLRYQLENVVLFCIALAVAVPHLRGALPRRLGRLPGGRGRLVRGLAVLCGVLVLAPLWVMSVQEEVQGHRGVESREWFDDVQATLAEQQRADPSLAFVDGVVPDWLVYGALAPYNSYRNVLSQTLPDARFTTTDERGLAIGADGVVRPVVFTPTEDLGGGGACLAPGAERRELDVTVALPEGRWFVRVRYTAREASAVEILLHNAGAAPGLMMASATYQTEGGQQQLVVAPGAVPTAQVTVQVTGPAEVCLEGVEIGTMRPER
jgi:hypothetical protein